LSTPTATLDNIQHIRAGGLPPMQVGRFTAAPGRPAEMDHRIVARAGVDSAPEGSFARYLGDTLEAELKGAGRFDPSSGLIVSGVITDTYLDSVVPKARARLGVRFTLDRNGRTVFQKSYSVESTWNSELLADVAVPDAFHHYAGLFPQVVGDLLGDPEFQAAVGRLP
jgi:hypothetical protein